MSAPHTRSLYDSDTSLINGAVNFTSTVMLFYNCNKFVLFMGSKGSWKISNGDMLTYGTSFPHIRINLSHTRSFPVQNSAQNILFSNIRHVSMIVAYRERGQGNPFFHISRTKCSFTFYDINVQMNCGTWEGKIKL